MRLKKIAVLTTGGDSPGMNTAIRAVVRSAIYYGFRIVGVERGYAGLIEGEIRPMDAPSVSGIINQGGTILRSVRCPEFETKAGMKKAAFMARAYRIDGLVVIGGDGSMRGAYKFNQHFHIPVVGIPATIDNDIAGTDCSFGFDTAVNTALDAIDKIRDTATSHERVFVIEVMGREKGFLALEVGLAGGAEAILVPEIKYSIDKICRKLQAGSRRGKKSSIIVAAEGAGSAIKIGEQIKKRTKLDVRVSVLGHLQRGGTPTAFSRNLANRFGAFAVKLMSQNKGNKMVGIQGGKIISRDISYPWQHKKKIDLSLYKLAEILAA